jgi:hypothetical protein
MGKIEDMRRQREQQFADAEQREAKAAKAVKPAPIAAPVAAPAAKVASAPASLPGGAEPPQPTRPTRPTASAKKTSSKSGGTVDEQGKCPDCRKMKPLSNGVLANHQKGFGKACSGSRKKPL